MYARCLLARAHEFGGAKERRFNNNMYVEQCDVKRLEWTPELVRDFWSTVSQTRLAELNFSKQVGPKLLDFRTSRRIGVALISVRGKGISCGR